jgi:DNA-directed RNA polymerase subunit H (RpoH/RPB5)
MSSDETNLVIETLIKYFLPYRGLKLSMDAQELTPDYINTRFATSHYYRMIAINKEPRGSRKWVFIYILDDDLSKTVQTPSKNKPKLVELLSNAESDPKYKDLDELMIIAPSSFFGKKALMDTINMFSMDKGIKIVDPTGTKPYYTAYPYYKFSCDMPNHVEVTEHEILSMDKAAEFMSFDRINKMESLMRITTMDTPIVWLGARDGQIVKIKRPSETTIESIAYRRVYTASSF